MAAHIIRLGSPRSVGEGLRLGTVRRPPRGVPKSAFASRDYYDVWLPTLAPSQDLLREHARGGDASADWAHFARRYRQEMKAPAAAQLLDLLAALSQDTPFALGCYCELETHCHRSILRELLAARGAVIDTLP